MAEEILTPPQKIFLEIFSHSNIVNSFYFSGGTALAHYYLHHRKSEDLDFFSTSEVDVQAIVVFLKTLKNKLGYQLFDYQQSFNRNLFFLQYSENNILKVEFTYYPFEQIEQPKRIDNIFVDSIIDIAANKLFTISQQPRGRDYFDLFAINKKTPIDFKKLRIQAKTKFDWQIDPLQLGSQLNRVDEFLDDPILMKVIAKSDVIDFFKQIAISFKTEILQ